MPVMSIFKERLAQNQTASYDNAPLNIKSISSFIQRGISHVEVKMPFIPHNLSAFRFSLLPLFLTKHNECSL